MHLFGPTRTPTTCLPATCIEIEFSVTQARKALALVDGMAVCATGNCGEPKRRERLFPGTIPVQTVSTFNEHFSPRLILNGTPFHSKPHLNPPAKFTPSFPLSHPKRRLQHASASYVRHPRRPRCRSLSQGAFTALYATFNGCIGEIEGLKTGKYPPPRKVVSISGVRMLLQLVIFYRILARKTR